MLIKETGGRHGMRRGRGRASFGALFRHSEDLRRRAPGSEEPRPRHQEGRVHHLAWPVGLGQDDHADDAGGLRDSDPWRHLPGRPADQEHAAAQARHRHGVPELCSVSAPDDRGECRLPAVRSQDQQGGKAGARAGGAADDQDGSPGAPAAGANCRAASSSAWRWPARWCSTRSSC